MIKEFYLSITNEQFNTNLAHIQYNLQKRLNAIAYIKYRRIDINLHVELNKPNSIDITWDDDRHAIIDCVVSNDVLLEVTSETDFSAAYKYFLHVLEAFWKSKHWNVDDLIAIWDEVSSEHFTSRIYYNKKYKSPDNKHTAEFLFEIYRNYANYYVSLKDKEGKVHNILFLKGIPEISLFFLLFVESAWKDNEIFQLIDFNKEIVLEFNAVNYEFQPRYFPRFTSLEQCKNRFLAYRFDQSPADRRRLMGLPNPS